MNIVRLLPLGTVGQQPRVFDTRGAPSWPIFARNVYHVENCYDPVPLVPISYDSVDGLVGEVEDRGRVDKRVEADPKTAPTAPGVSDRRRRARPRHLLRD